MILAVQIFQIIFYSIAIIFMGTLILISIWGFITFNKLYKTQRVQNFLLDKIYQSIIKLDFKSAYTPEDTEDTKGTEDVFDVDEIINEDELFNHSFSNDNDNANKNNI